MGIKRDLIKSKILLISGKVNHINLINVKHIDYEHTANLPVDHDRHSLQKYDALIFDFDLLPTQSGSRLKPFFIKLKFLPVLVVVAENEPKLKTRLLNAGAFDVLTYSELQEPAILRRAIEYAVENYKLSNRVREYKRALHISQKIARVGSWWWNIDSDEFWASPILLDLLNIPTETGKITMRDIMALAGQEDKKRISAIVFENIRKKTSFAVEFKKATANGDLKYFRLKGQVNKTWVRKELIYQGTCQEVTTEKKKSENLQQKSMFLELLGQYALVGGWEHDFITGGLYWSDETYKIHGISPNDFSVRMDNLHLLYSTDVLNEMNASFEKSIKEKGNFFAEVPYQQFNQIKWLQYVGRIIFKNKTPIKVVGIVYDITEHKTQFNNLQLRAALLDNVEVAVIAIDKNHKIVFWNKEAEKLFGYAKNETIGRDINDFDIDNNTPTEYEELERKIMKGEVIAREYLVKSRDGKKMPVWGAYSAVFDADQQFVASLYLARNIAKEKERINRLENSETRLRRLFEHTPIGRGLIDLQTYKWLDVNNSLVKLLGYSREHLLNNSIRNIVTPEYSNHHFFQFDSLKKLKSFGPFQMEYFKNNGARLKVIKTGFIIHQNDKSSAWIDVMDITELDEKTESLRKSEERFRDYVENATDVILTIDDKGQIDYISPNVHKTLNYEVSQLKGVKYLNFIHPDDKRKTMEQVAAAMQNRNEDISVIHRVRHNDGTYLYVQSEGKFRFGPSGDKYGIIISRNIDQAYRSELTIRKQHDVLKEIAFIQSHVLRRPLANIMGMLNLVKHDEELTQEQARIAELIRKEANTMDVVVNEIVEKSKLISNLAK